MSELEKIVKEIQLRPAQGLRTFFFCALGFKPKNLKE